MLAKLPKTLIGKRNRALILLGYAGVLRRSELVAINVEEVAFTDDGIRLAIRQAKTDQEGTGHVIGIAHGGALCPVRGLAAWLETSGIKGGPVFRAVTRHGQLQEGRLTDQVVASVVKAGSAADLNPMKYAGHSLRAGLVTQATLNDVPEYKIMRQTRHKASDMVRKYIREANLFKDNASARVGL